MSPRYIRHYGRWFLILATFPEADIAAANAYMLANEGAALLTIEAGTAYLAHVADKGRPELPAEAEGVTA